MLFTIQTAVCAIEIFDSNDEFLFLALFSFRSLLLQWTFDNVAFLAIESFEVFFFLILFNLTGTESAPIWSKALREEEKNVKMKFVNFVILFPHNYNVWCSIGCNKRKEFFFSPSRLVLANERKFNFVNILSFSPFHFVCLLNTIFI